MYCCDCARGQGDKAADPSMALYLIGEQGGGEIELWEEETVSW